MGTGGKLPEGMREGRTKASLMSGFFDKVKDSVDVALTDVSQKLQKGVDQVVVGAGEALQESHLRAQYRLLERDVTERLAALGGKVFAMHQAGEVRVAELAGDFAEIQEMEERLTAKRQAIEALGPRVGARVAPAAPAEETLCACGAANAATAKFCRACGQPMARAEGEPSQGP